jgi:DNA-binding FrmR family transcriptional regulator
VAHGSELSLLFRSRAITAVSRHTSGVSDDKEWANPRWTQKPWVAYHIPLGYMPPKNHYNDREKQKLLSRIKRVRGQFAAIERALTAGDDCADILMLLAAARGGVNSLMAEVLEDHIRLHMINPGKNSTRPEELAEDLIDLVRAYLK